MHNLYALDEALNQVKKTAIYKNLNPNWGPKVFLNGLEPGQFRPIHDFRLYILGTVPACT